MKKLLSVLALGAAGVLSSAAVASADTVKVTSNDVPGASWNVFERPLGTYEFVAGPAQPPLGRGSVELSTPDAIAKITLLNTDHVGTPLATIDELGYATYRDPSSTASDVQLPAINLEADVNGAAAGGFTTLVYEPVYNDRERIAEGVWQTWDAYRGGDAIWWSSRSIAGVCAFDCFVTWDAIVAANPDATALRYGVNQGGGNAGLLAATDALALGAGGESTTYDFEPLTAPPVSKDECKDGGWQTFDNPSFENQGDCVSFVASS